MVDLDGHAPAVARVLFVFLDGLGLGAADAVVNPIAAAELPRLDELLGGSRPLFDAAPLHTAQASLVGLDAVLGVAGTPQSGTGQAALLTGENAARLFGRHFGPWTPTPLRSLLAERNLLGRAQRAGLGIAFANAYPEELVSTLDGTGRPGLRLEGAIRRGLPRAGPPLAALAAGVLNRHAGHLSRGDAVASEITNDVWRLRLGQNEIPAVTPEQAGRNLARIASGHDLTLFAHYNLDYFGHRGAFAEAVAAIERVDTFIGAAYDALPSDTLLIVASDHGNIEDVRRGHTRNPAVALVAGPGHRDVAGRLRALTDVTPEIMRYLGV